MGLLDVINGMQNGPRGASVPSQTTGKGGMSPITMAILALLAYKGIKHLTAGQAQAAPANTGNANLNQASLPGGGGGGLGDILGSVLGGGSVAGGGAGT